MNEKETAIQYLIWKKHKHGLVLPNIHTEQYGGSEVDALYITNSNYAWFYEIKCSLSDFRADKNKKRHKQFLAKSEGLKIYPKHFIYVCHGFIPPVEEIPEYAGCYVSDTYFSLFRKPLKKAPVIYNKPLDSNALEFIYKKLYYRYLNQYYKDSNKLIKKLGF